MGIFNKGILGINARNLLYISPFNKELSVEIADDKLKTKAFLSARGIPVPKLLATIGSRAELTKFNFNKLGAEFVLKPNLGFGGQGIIPIYRKENSFYQGPDNQQYSREDLLSHIKDILSGHFSITDKPDKAFFEKLIISDDIVGKYSFGGLPDIRIIVHNLVPVMAMLRIPTKESGGKANLHMGAIGGGIDLAKGEITYLTSNGRVIKEIPGKGSIKGLKIPFWDDILRIACQCQLASNLGYMGADIALDKQQGPVLLEINARAGLGIQIANLAPLRKRLEKLEGVEVKTVEKGIRIAKDMFGYSIEKNIKSISGKKVIGIYEKTTFFNADEPVSAVAFINTSRRKSYIGPDLAKKLGLITSKKQKDLEDLKFRLKFKIGEKKLTSIFKIDKNLRKKYQIIIGNRDLGGQFLIDTSINNLIEEKKKGETKQIFITNYDPLESDRQICKVSSQMKFLSYFRPVNFHEEAKKFLADRTYNPVFRYKENSEELEDLGRQISRIKYDDTDLGRLFQKKILELKTYLDLIRCRGSDDFTSQSALIFGTTTRADIDEIAGIQPPTPSQNSRQKYSSLELKEIFEKKLAEYGLRDWRVILKKHLLTKCVVNRNKKILIKSNSSFSASRIAELIIHEIDTHLLTSENGARQKYKLFNYGFANYLETQEGLAMHNEISQGNIHSEEFHKNILTESIYLAQKMSLAELYDNIKQRKLTDKSAIDICFRVKRGIGDTSRPGAFTKDYLYFSGRKKIRTFIEQGGDLADLYHGKYSLDDLASIKNISAFKTPPFLPDWLK
jgi:alpha-L-glutamate ligase-like protein